MSSSDSNPPTMLYEAINVWKRISDTESVCYRCFKNIVTHRYCVQSADFYTLPLDPKQLASLELQHLELLMEQDPIERAGSFDSLVEAIKAHEAEFLNE
jgi:hypothetical protein